MRDSVGAALRSLRAHRLRSALTMLGIVIGTASLVVMTAVGVGAKERIATQIRSLGANVITISPGSALMNSVRLGSGASPKLGAGDAVAIRREIPEAVSVAPLLYGRAQFTVGAANWAGSIRGVEQSYLTIRDWTVTDGRPITDDDDRRAAKVLLLGDTMRRKLFGDTNPVGEKIRVRDVPFTIIGLLARKGQSVWGEDQDDIALMPLRTARQQFVGFSPANPSLVHNILVKFGDGASADQIMRSIHRLLVQRHGLWSAQDDSFRISNLAEAAELEENATRVVSALLTAMASVSLLVGGIGIMNIMLATVSERTPEVGIRLAVGARRRDILRQFVVEAMVLALIGGVAGSGLGVGVSFFICRLAEWPMVVDLSSIIAAIGFAVAVGCFFGYYPARRAARLQPISAIRGD